ncbi:UDP-glucose 4-epimerase domain protein [Xanthomonas citri pv. mangiferaeindicae LMG 941]|nr:UDP-glucose 4-epimerase domain protein [Xanthomonas citri pv. mangiferaeindicae LMG 941]
MHDPSSKQCCPPRLRGAGANPLLARRHHPTRIDAYDVMHPRHRQASAVAPL